MKKQGVHFHTRLSQSQSFYNPLILSRLVEFTGIEPFGTNIENSQVYDPLHVPSNWKIDALKDRMQQDAEIRAHAAVQPYITSRDSAETKTAVSHKPNPYLSGRPEKRSRRR